MILYHGSNVKVNEPKILIPNRFLDFGNGFYTTSNFVQARNFADKVFARKKSGESTVSEYFFDDSALEKLSVLKFDYADEKWLDFVSDNRNGIDCNDNYDLIVGPVADDDIFRTFILYSTGVLTKEQTLEVLKIKKLFNQYVFKSDKSISFLEFRGVVNG